MYPDREGFPPAGIVCPGILNFEFYFWYFFSLHLTPNQNLAIMEQNQGSSLFTLNLDAQNSYMLRSAASWARVLGVASLIMGICFVILGVIVQQAVTSSGGYSTYETGGFSASTIGNMGLVVYVLMGLVFIISAIFAMNAGNKIISGLKNNDQRTLNAGFAGARNFFALWAILTILSLVLILISVLGALGQS